MKIQINILVVVLLVVSAAVAQRPNMDSLLLVYEQQPYDTTRMMTLNHLINATMYRSPSQSMDYANEMSAMAYELGLKKWQSLSHFHLGALHNNLDNYDQARVHFDQSFRYASEIADTMRLVLAINGRAVMEMNLGNYKLADSLNAINIDILTRKNDQYRLSTAYGMKSSINHSQGNYNIAYRYALDAVRILEQMDRPVRLADALVQLSDVEFSLKNLEHAIEHTIRALGIYRQAGDLMYQAQVLTNLGDMYLETDDESKAFDHLQEAIMMADSAGNESIKATAFNNLGRWYSNRKQYSNAETAYENAWEIFSRIEDIHGQVQTLLLLGELRNNTQNYSLAIETLSQAIDLAEEGYFTPERSESLRLRSFSYEQLGQNGRAIDDLKKHKVLSDSLFASERLRQIDELRIIYETEKKEQEIELQRFEIALLAEKQRNNRFSIALLMVLLVSVVTTALLVFQNFRQKFRRQKLEAETTRQVLDLKKRELTTQVLHIAQKNELLKDLKATVLEGKKNEPDSSSLRQVLSKLNMDAANENSWERFRIYFDELHKGFEEKIRQVAPDISSGELRLISLIKMNLNSQEIASVLNISGEGIKKARYRLRKKLGLEGEGSLEDFLLEFETQR
jgi:tetratricopeptide (TPR) repeat protein